MLAGFTQAALDLVFPALCPLCQTTLGADRRDPLCASCWRGITRLGRPRCHVCGAAPPLAPTFDDAGEPAPPAPSCAACAADPPPYDYARSAALFEGALREAVHALKYSGRRALARPLGDLAAGYCSATLAEAIEAVVPVPLARDRGRERGFNQAELLAQRVAHRLGVPVRPRWLWRVRPTRPQSDLAASERRANVRGAFRASPQVSGRHVLVVDDVLTTGATLGECARALREGGARRVGVLTVARVPHPAV
jgi:ComF family protein